MNLVLFVCKVAAARQLGELGLAAHDDRLARDPLPISFPAPAPRFTVQSERVGSQLLRDVPDTEHTETLP
jgi:hypothetical protein